MSTSYPFVACFRSVHYSSLNIDQRSLSKLFEYNAVRTVLSCPPPICSPESSDHKVQMSQIRFLMFIHNHGIDAPPLWHDLCVFDFELPDHCVNILLKMNKSSMSTSRFSSLSTGKSILDMAAARSIYSVSKFRMEGKSIICLCWSSPMEQHKYAVYSVLSGVPCTAVYGECSKNRIIWYTLPVIFIMI
jgi:hypothetical protein